MSFDNIPGELRALNQWLVWRSELRENANGETKVTKVPYRARKKGLVKASSTNPDTWSAFDYAVRRATEVGDVDGIGFVFTADDPYIGIDIDDPDPGNPRDFDGLPDETGTYAEYSPSGTGIHLIGRGTTPDGNGRHPKGIGIFQQERFFTMTGNVLDGEIRPIANIQGVIDRHWPEWFPDPGDLAPIPAISTPFFASDQEIIDKCREASNGHKFDRLFGGDLGDVGGDHSAADLALCSILAFYTQDRDQIVRIFTSSALGKRAKWRKRADYREMTVSKALQRSEFYTPPVASQSGLTIIRSKHGDGTESQVFTFNTTDKGNSHRVIHHYGDAIRYCHSTKSWLIWDGRRWREDDDSEILRICMATAETIYDEAASVADKSSSMAKSLEKWAVKSEESARVLAMPKLTQAFRELGVKLTDLDDDPMLLNVENGVVNLADGSFRPHQRGDHLTKLAPVRYEYGATSPTFDRFLSTVFAGNDRLIRFVQKGLGYSLTGDTTERCMFILYGSGRNGKSTLVETIGRILGDYAASSSADLITARKGDAPMATDLARLPGVRFTAASETGEYSRLDEARVKNITGGDRIIGERKYRDPFEYDPQFKIWLSTNHQPNIQGIDEGIWDRIQLIPFTVRIPDNHIDRYLKDKLLAEASGILNWLIEGALLWQSEGLGRDDTVSEATAQYRESMDSLGSFIRECCKEEGSSVVSELYGAYEQWAKDSGEHPLPKRRLTNRLRDRGFPITRVGTRNVHTIQGLRLLFNSEIRSTSGNGSSDNIVPYRRNG